MIGEEAGPSSSDTVTLLEKHIAVIAEPAGEYVTHFTPSSGKALDIFQELHDIAGELGGEVVIIGADETAVNTGKNAGVCFYLKYLRVNQFTGLFASCMRMN